MIISHLDHLVLTVNNIQDSIDFYTQALGMELMEYSEGRKALRFGAQKINLHQAGQSLSPHAAQPVPGSADLCFICTTPIQDILTELQAKQITIIDGPVERTGTNSQLLSLYIRDPDGNLIELSNPL